ncbi:MAG: VOC family protein [Micromonosporaceae bacterium]
MTTPRRGGLHHVELWVPDLHTAVRGWGWLLGELGYGLDSRWPNGITYRLDDCYLVLEQSPALSATTHERTRPGLNHLAFHAGTRVDVDRLVAAAPDHGWVLLFPDRHPYAGGPDHYAGYLTDGDGYEVELVAVSPGGARWCSASQDPTQNMGSAAQPPAATSPSPPAVRRSGRLPKRPALFGRALQHPDTPRGRPRRGGLEPRQESVQGALAHRDL